MPPVSKPTGEAQYLADLETWKAKVQNSLETWKAQRAHALEWDRGAFVFAAMALRSITLVNGAAAVAIQERETDIGSVAFITTRSIDNSFTLPIRRLVSGPLAAESERQRLHEIAIREGVSITVSEVPLRSGERSSPGD